MIAKVIDIKFPENFNAGFLQNPAQAVAQGRRSGRHNIEGPRWIGRDKFKQDAIFMMRNRAKVAIEPMGKRLG